MVMRKYIIWLMIGLLMGMVSFAQKTSDKTNMINERNQIQQELKEIQNALNAVKGQQKENLTQLAALNRKLVLQERYINNIGKEIHLIDDDIYYSALEINRLKKQLDTLKSHYARTVVYAYKNRSNYDYLNFIFSSTNFNDAMKRIAYLKSYRDYRQKQVNNITKTSTLIAKRYDQQVVNKNKKKSAIESRADELSLLAVQKAEKDSVVAQLKSQAGDLQKQITKKQKRDKELKSSIAAVVRKEIDEARKLAREDAKQRAEADRKARAEALAKQQAEAERKALAEAKARDLTNTPPADVKKEEEESRIVGVKPTVLPKSTKVEAGTSTTSRSVPSSQNTNLTVKTTSVAPARSSTPAPVVSPPPPKPENKVPEGGYLNYKAADIALNSDFSQNRGRLPSPVSGVITLGFGRYRIEGVGPDVVGDNPGVTFTASVGSPVKAVFDGEVASVSSIAGMSFVVLRHGKYFTAYSNLGAVSVGKGSKVSRGQTIGTVGVDDETGNGKLDFILMIEERNVDPRAWLAR